MGTPSDQEGARDRGHARAPRGALARLGLRHHLHAWSGGAAVALTVAISTIVGLRSVARFEPPRLTPLLDFELMPRESLAIAWSPRTVWPADLQAAALEKLLVIVAVLFLAVAIVATLNAVVLLAESAGSRRGELAVRSALGASPATLGLMMLRELRTLLVAATGLGLLLGFFAGAVARVTWPGRPIDVEIALSGDALAGLGVVMALVVSTYLVAGWQMARGGRAAISLRAGTRGGADPMAVFFRKVLAAVHTASAGAVLVGALTLAGALDDAGTPVGGAEDTVVFDVTSREPGLWPELLGDLDRIPGMEAESLAAPGALLDLGVRAISTAECGNCWRSLMPAPLWNATADHHSVAPGFFELAGLSVLDGRDFTAADVDGSARVAIVNEAFAGEAFENGEPLGKRVRIGSAFASWYTVIGVVEDQSVTVLGGDDLRRAAVYLSAYQQPPRSGAVLLRGSDDAVAQAESMMTSLGLSPSPPRSVAAYRSEAAETLRWAYGVATLLALLALLLAAHGVYHTALQTTRRRTTELAIRRAVGAPSRRIVTYVLGERVRVVAWGLTGFVFLGTLVAGLLQDAAGMRAVGPTAYLAIAGLLITTALLASLRAAEEALRVEPASVLE